jgi:hypothetical protein
VHTHGHVHWWGCCRAGARLAVDDDDDDDDDLFQTEFTLIKETI